MSRDAQAVVLAGGLGTRMRATTGGDLPKFLLPVAGRPFALWLLERVAACGFSEVVLCIGHLGDAVRAVIGDGRGVGIPVRYAEDGPNLLGTAGALRQAVGLLRPDFLVTYGDSYLPFDYAAPLANLRAHAGALGTMAVFRNQNRLDTSNVRIAGERVARYEKRARNAPVDPELDHIDYGATALRREVIEALEPGRPHELSEVQAQLAKDGKLRACLAKERFFEVGSEQGLRDLERELRGLRAVGAGA